MTYRFDPKQVIHITFKCQPLHHSNWSNTSELQEVHGKMELILIQKLKYMHVSS